MHENLPIALVRSVSWEDPSVSGDGFVLPSGTVTLLLGDVEGSTRAWEADPQTTEAAILELNEVIDELVGRFDGVRPVEQGEGDSFVAAFARARDGIGCALAIQRALSGAVLKLRLGVHTGDVVRRDEGNYVGPAIIRTARLRNLAHGGQTVVSEVTRDLVTDVLPEEMTLQDLGVHRLKDLSRPERVFQLGHRDLPGEFPPLRSLDAHPHNLPVQRTTFIGRAGELAKVIDLVDDERLVTLTGSGGCGKTRLALQVAAEVVDDFADGVWLVDLTTVTVPDGVAAKAIQALSAPQSPGLGLVEMVVAHLGDRQALVVLDNCEQVCEAAAALADAVVAGCPGVRVLATSRQPLALEGELCWRVPSLSLPPPDAGPSGVEGLKSSDAVQLFVERAGRAHPGFVLEDRHQEPVTEICRRLDGIPLAIELAAARVRVLTPAQIAAGLSERFSLLTGAARTALPRQQTLEASLDWSHALLTDLEQALFRRLGVFAGTFDLDAAMAVGAAADIAPWQVLDLVTLLIDKNLVAVDDTAEVARYRLLETVRLYALRHLGAAGEEELARTRHREYYLALVETAAPGIESTQAPVWLALLDADYPNLEAALTWSRDRGDVDELCRMVTALDGVWGNGGIGLRVPLVVGAGWIDAALGTGATMTPRMRGTLCRERSVLAWTMGDYDTAITMADQGLRVAREHDDDWLLGRMLLGSALVLMGSLAAKPVWQEAIAAARRADDTYGLAETLACAAAFCYIYCDPASAQRCIEESVTLGQAVNLTAFGIGRVAGGALLLHQGRLSDAIEALDEGLGIGVRTQDPIIILCAELGLASVHPLAGRQEEALSALANLAEMRERTGMGSADFDIFNRALVVAALGDVAAAVELIEAALACQQSPLNRAQSLRTAANISLLAGNVAVARRHTAELLDLTRDEEMVFYAAEAQLLDARVKRLSEEFAASEHRAHAALSAAMSLPAWTTVVDALETIGGLAADAESYEEGARLLGAAEALRDATGYGLCLSERDADLAKIRDALGEERTDAAISEGRGLSVDDAVAYAQRGRGERKRPSVGWDSLTPTEVQIIELIRDGCTNAVIGKRLFVSARTVQSYLTRIYTKLGVTSRTELAARAGERGS